jgi:hypothetical protein
MIILKGQDLRVPYRINRTCGTGIEKCALSGISKTRQKLDA